MGNSARRVDLRDPGIARHWAEWVVLISCSILLVLWSARSFAASAISSGDDIQAFQFKASHWPKNTALEYRETQIGINRLDSLSTLYFDPQYNLQALKLLRDDRQPLLVTARFNWAIASVVEFGAWSLPRTADEKPHAIGKFDAAKRSFSIILGRLGTKTISVNSLPFHVHDFELMSLGVAMRFLRSPERPFTFELIGLDRKDHIFFKDSGRILVKYDGSVYCRDDSTRRCREYVMLWGKSMKYFGRVQLEVSTGDLVLVETVVPDEPGIVSLRLQLVRGIVMTPAKWKETLAQAPERLHAIYPGMRPSAHHK